MRNFEGALRRGKRRAIQLSRVGLFACRFWAARPAFATEAEPVRIEYTAPAACPDDARFVAAVAGRTSRFRRVDGTERVRTFRVAVSATPGGRFSGMLELRQPDDVAAARRVDGVSCDEVVNALALMTALAIDPAARADANQESLPEVATPLAPQQPAPAMRAVAQSPPSRSEQSGAGAPSQAPWHWSVGATARGGVDSAPLTRYGGELFVDAELRQAPEHALAVRGGFVLERAAVGAADGPGGTFLWAGLRLEACPLRLSLGASRWALDPCLSAHLGAVRGEGQGLDRPMERVTVWADGGAVLRGRWGATAHLTFEAGLGLVMPLNRPIFEALDRGAVSTIYAVPPWVAQAGAGVAYRFH